jgi:hypothetical protein
VRGQRKEESMKKQKRYLSLWGFVFGVAALSGLLGGCATMEPKKPPAMVPTDRGTVVYLEKYEFKRPPEGWALMRNVEGGDFELGFMRIEKGDFPTQTTFMYDEQPYGSSQDLEKRADYYCTKFLFNSGIEAKVTKREKATVAGRAALVLEMGGENPVQKEKAKSQIYLVKKGNRIVSFVCTQWRPLTGTFSGEPFAHFEAFVQNFKFLTKDFYEQLEEEITKAGL